MRVYEKGQKYSFRKKRRFVIDLRRSQLSTTEHRLIVNAHWLNLFIVYLFIYLFISIFQSLATGVVQLFLALPKDRTRWTHVITGVVCLVKDGIAKSYYIIVLDLKVSILVNTRLQRAVSILFFFHVREAVAVEK